MVGPRARRIRPATLTAPAPAAGSGATNGDAEGEKASNVGGEKASNAVAAPPPMNDPFYAPVVLKEGEVDPLDAFMQNLDGQDKKKKSKYTSLKLLCITQL